MLACGGPPSAATERPSVAPEPPPSQSEARVEADVEPTHADPVVPGEDATSVRVRETIASVGARVVAVETTSDGGPPVVDVELGATRLRTPVAWEAVGALRAGKILAMKGVGGYQLLCNARDERAAHPGGHPASNG